MFEKLTIVAAVTALLVLTACSDSAVDTPDAVASESTVTDASGSNNAATNVPSYKITEDEVKGNIKRTVEVQLSSRTDENTLNTIAEEIYALSNKEVERTFIGYRIVGEGTDQAFWAKTDYDPGLKVHIMGKNAADYERLKNIPFPEGVILGSWMVANGIDYRMVAYIKDGKAYMQTTYDTKGIDEEYKLTQIDKGVKLQIEGEKGFNDYFIVNGKGNLEFWNENGNYYTAKKM